MPAWKVAGGIAGVGGAAGGARPGLAARPAEARLGLVARPAGPPGATWAKVQDGASSVPTPTATASSLINISSFLERIALDFTLPVGATHGLTGHRQLATDTPVFVAPEPANRRSLRSGSPGPGS